MHANEEELTFSYFFANILEKLNFDNFERGEKMLKLRKIKINDIKFGRKTRIENKTLWVNKKELLEVVKGSDSRIASISANIAKPGEKIRIVPIKDIIEPRIKIEGPGAVFPGFLGPQETVGNGYTLALKGISVITCGQIIGFQEGLLDMSGPGAQYSYFSKLTNLVICPKVAQGLTQHQHEETLRMAGLRAAAYLAQAGKGIEPDEVEEFEALSPKTDPQIQLPKVLYVYMILSQGLLHDTYIYGKDSKEMMPTVLQPTEIMDGAIVSGNCVSACDKNCTYHHQNNPVIEELYKKHKKEINFIGVIVSNVCTTLAEKQRSANFAVKLAEYLGAEGAIISKEGFGNPDADMMMICAGLEKGGIKTVCLTDEYAGSDGASQSLADTTEKANAVISCGNANEIVVLPPMKKTIGGLNLVKNLAGASPKSLKENGSLEVELQVILGATNQLGFEKLSTREV